MKMIHRTEDDLPKDPEDGVTTDEDDDKGHKLPGKEREKGSRPSTRIGSDGVERRIVYVPTFRDPSETAWIQRLSENGLSNNDLANGVCKTTPPGTPNSRKLDVLNEIKRKPTDDPLPLMKRGRTLSFRLSYPSNFAWFICNHLPLAIMAKKKKQLMWTE